MIPVKNLNFLIKPASSLCNLRCRYCFYADEAANRAQASMGLMSDGTVDLLLAEAFRTVDRHGLVSFTFQGGEPTLAGLDFFQSFVQKAGALCPSDVKTAFSIQTNGVLLDSEWAEFFRREDFLVGLSIDGFKELHNAHRVNGEGGTWNAVHRQAESLLRRGVRTNALCVVTAQCARSPQKVYASLKKLGFDYMQFIACIDPMGAERGRAPFSLTPRAYGEFLCALFDLWYRDWERGEYHSIRLFEDYIHILLRDGSSTCATCGQCGSYFVVEGDGSVYPCDFFALDTWRMGRLGEQSLVEMADGETSRRFLAWGREKPAQCTSCPWRQLCGGGCKNDWVQEPEGIRNYYCEAFQMLFAHGIERMMTMARAEQAQRVDRTGAWRRPGRSPQVQGDGRGEF